MVYKDIGSNDIDATQSRLITPDGYGESLGCERLEFPLMSDLDNWARMSK